MSTDKDTGYICVGDLAIHQIRELTVVIWRWSRTDRPAVRITGQNWWNTTIRGIIKIKCVIDLNIVCLSLSYPIGPGDLNFCRAQQCQPLITWHSFFSGFLYLGCCSKGQQKWIFINMKNSAGITFVVLLSLIYCAEMALATKVCLLRTAESAKCSARGVHLDASETVWTNK